MKIFPVPTRFEQESFLLRLYFGAGSEYLQLCVQRAYLDFSRTLHGIGNIPNVRNKAAVEVKQALMALRDDRKVIQETFDEWHRETCFRLCSIYKEQGYKNFHVGQAQKWLNMSLKYIYVIGDQRLPGYDHLNQFCHVPLDWIIVQRLQEEYSAPELSSSWSRLDNYEEYLRFQQWIRKTFVNSAPLAVEFNLWQHDTD